MVDYSNHYMSDIVDCIIQVRVIFLLMKILSVKWRIKKYYDYFSGQFPNGDWGKIPLILSFQYMHILIMIFLIF